MDVEREKIQDDGNSVTCLMFLFNFPTAKEVSLSSGVQGHVVAVEVYENRVQNRRNTHHLPLLLTTEYPTHPPAHSSLSSISILSLLCTVIEVLDIACKWCLGGYAVVAGRHEMDRTEHHIRAKV